MAPACCADGRADRSIVRRIDSISNCCDSGRADGIGKISDRCADVRTNSGVDMAPGSSIDGRADCCTDDVFDCCAYGFANSTVDEVSDCHTSGSADSGIDELSDCGAELTTLTQADCGFPSTDFSALFEKCGLSYQASTEEYSMRQAIFEWRTARIASHSRNPAGLHTAETNHFADWVQEELATLRGHKSRRGASGGVDHTPFLLAKRGKGNDQPVPTDLSWGHLASTKANSSEQDACSSRWAHASRLTLESRAGIKGRKSTEWSANQFIASTPNPKYCGGEGGSAAELAYEYVFSEGLLQAGETCWEPPVLTAPGAEGQ